jgi:hypothetical protein
MRQAKRLILLGSVAGVLWGQAAQSTLLGTLAKFRPETGALEVKSDQGAVTEVKLAADTVLRRVQPGERDLTKAEALQVADLAVGDRLLVTLAPDGGTARRVVVMAATAIAGRNEAERKDWMERGVTGIVDGKRGNEITLRMRTMAGETKSTVVIDEATKLRRYLPGSVKFSEAQASTLAAVSIGDQLRARGRKSPDGLRVEAEDVVFGTFLTRAGTVASVDAEARQIRIKEAGEGKMLTVTVTADSQLKKMPPFGGGGPPGGSPGQEGRQRAMGAGGPGPGGGAPGGPGRPGGPPDVTQMLERMPAAQFEDIKVGETIVVSSTKGAKPDLLTAIMLLANAEFLVRMATAQSNAGGGAGGRGMQGMGGMSGGLGGLELPGLVP